MSHNVRMVGAVLVTSAFLLMVGLTPASAQGIYGPPMGGGMPYGQPTVPVAHPSPFSPFNPFSFGRPFDRIRIHFGDTLAGIAARFGVSERALLRANPQIVDPDLIFAGQHLVIPRFPSRFPEFHGGY